MSHVKMHRRIGSKPFEYAIKNI